jgi:hypothetical protein
VIPQRALGKSGVSVAVVDCVIEEYRDYLLTEFRAKDEGLRNELKRARRFGITPYQLGGGDIAAFVKRQAGGKLEPVDALAIATEMTSEETERRPTIEEVGARLSRL